MLGGMKKNQGRLAVGKDEGNAPAPMDASAEEPRPPAESALPAKKSNADFRAMLLGGKS